MPGTTLPVCQCVLFRNSNWYAQFMFDAVSEGLEAWYCITRVYINKLRQSYSAVFSLTLNLRQTIIWFGEVLDFRPFRATVLACTTRPNGLKSKTTPNYIVVWRRFRLKTVPGNDACVHYPSKRPAEFELVKNSHLNKKLLRHMCFRASVSNVVEDHTKKRGSTPVQREG